jgi:nucleotide-binding universal stress UspA family protein
MRVLIAYDGGPAGDKALAAIASWARESSAEVHALTVLKPSQIHETAMPSAMHAYTPASTPTGTAVGSSEPRAVLAETRSQAMEAAKVRAAERLQTVVSEVLLGIAVTVHIEVAEDAATTIVALAAKIDAALIAVGTHSRTGIQHALMGSVAEAVVRNATLPVLVVGPHVK